MFACNIITLTSSKKDIRVGCWKKEGVKNVAKPTVINEKKKLRNIKKYNCQNRFFNSDFQKVRIVHVVI